MKVTFLHLFIPDLDFWAFRCGGRWSIGRAREGEAPDSIAVGFKVLPRCSSEPDKQAVSVTPGMEIQFCWGLRSFCSGCSLSIFLMTSFLCCVENPTRYLSSTNPKISEHGVIKVLNTFVLELDVVEVLGEM